MLEATPQQPNEIEQKNILFLLDGTYGFFIPFSIILLARTQLRAAFNQITFADGIGSDSFARAWPRCDGGGRNGSHPMSIA